MDREDELERELDESAGPFCECIVPDPENDEPWVPARCALCGRLL